MRPFRWALDRKPRKTKNLWVIKGASNARKSRKMVMSPAVKGAMISLLAAVLCVVIVVVVVAVVDRSAIVAHILTGVEDGWR